MTYEATEIIDMRMSAEHRERIIQYLKHGLFCKIADDVPFPIPNTFKEYKLILRAYDEPFDGLGRKIVIRADLTANNPHYGREVMFNG